jgi:hypothetical protein
VQGPGLIPRKAKATTKKVRHDIMGKRDCSKEVFSIVVRCGGEKNIF